MPGALPESDTDIELVLPESIAGPTRRRVLRSIAAVVAVLLVLALALLLLRRPAGTTEYRTAPVERRTIVETVEATGHLDVLSRFHVPAPVAGRVLEIFVDPGATVAAGDPLAQLDEEAARMTLRGARAALQAASGRVAEARAALKATQDTLSRTERLASRGLASPNELARARAESLRTQAGLEAARAERAVVEQEVAQAERTEHLGTLRAPVGGVVLAVSPARGAAVAPEGGPLFVIGSSLDRMRLSIDVAEADIGQVRVGQPATFRVPAYPQRVFAGHVERVDLDGDRTQTAVTYPVALEVDNAEGALLPAMTATTAIEVGRAEGVLSVREAALRLAPEQAEPAPARSRVWVLRGEQIEPVSVVAGASDGSYTEVTVEAGGALEVGEGVAIGVHSQADARSTGPGISLGRK
jgi:HlyD family secretion protein